MLRIYAPSMNQHLLAICCYPPTCQRALHLEQARRRRRKPPPSSPSTAGVGPNFHPKLDVIDCMSHNPFALTQCSWFRMQITWPSSFGRLAKDSSASLSCDLPFELIVSTCTTLLRVLDRPPLGLLCGVRFTHLYVLHASSNFPCAPKTPFAVACRATAATSATLARNKACSLRCHALKVCALSWQQPCEEAISKLVQPLLQTVSEATGPHCTRKSEDGKVEARST